jgi:hypothetical protein
MDFKTLIGARRLTVAAAAVLAATLAAAATGRRRRLICGDNYLENNALARIVRRRVLLK